jgi:hypothetical protein
MALAQCPAPMYQYTPQKWDRNVHKPAVYVNLLSLLVQAIIQQLE